MSSSRRAGSSAVAGSSATGGAVSSAGGSGAGSSSAKGGAGATGGTTKHTGGVSGGGASGGSYEGGTTASGGSGGKGGVAGTTASGTSTRPDAGIADSGGALEGGAGGAGGFQPCPANEACKILPLGDSITWGINYGGGYRIKLAIKAAADQKNIVYVGYDAANPPDANALGKLGDAKDKYVNKHEGHSGWTIQQDDELVTGKSTANNDGVNYTGKKVVKDFGPHIVLVHLGTNDMYRQPNGAPERLGTLIDHIVADAPDALVVVSNIIPFPSGASAVSTFNKAVPDVVKEHAHGGHVIFVDQFAGFQNSDLGTDQVHPNEGGYEKMAVVWYKAIKPYLP